MKSRPFIILFFFVTWALLLSAHLFYYTFYAQETYYKLGNKLAWRKGVLKARRGKIITKDGIVVAYNEVMFDLYLKSEPELLFVRQKVFTSLKKILGDFSRTMHDEKVLLKKNISPNAIIEISRLNKKYDYFKIIKRVERRVYDHPNIKKCVGEISEGVGVSGFEKIYNKTLTGNDGFFLFMLDRYAHWVKGTLSNKREPINGDDVILMHNLKDIMKGSL